MKPSAQLRVTLCQTDIVWQDIEANFVRLSPKLAALPETDLVVLPEMFATGFTMQPDTLPDDVGERCVAWLSKQAKQTGACYCASTPYRLPDGQFVNRMVFVEPSGKTRYYDKRHRFAMAGEHEAYAPGSALPVVVRCKGWRLLLQVCYDLRFPCFARNTAGDAGYDAMIYVANWPEARRVHWQVLARARAIENQAYCLVVNRVGSDENGLNYVGDTCAIDAHGDVLVAASDGEEAMISTQLDYSALQALRRRLPFLADADAFRLLP